MMKTTKLTMTLTVAVVVAAAAQADDAPKAIPVYKTYTLRDGREVALSGTQWRIANGQAHALSPETIAALAATITVSILVDQHDGSHMYATGFFISASEVLTNWHVARDADNITVIMSDGHRANGQLKIGRPQVDLAIINVPSVTNEKAAAFDSDSDWERVGERVYVYGGPQGLAGTFCEGMLSAWRANGALMQISAPIDSGSSGSPVFNAYGLVIGIVSEGIVSTAQLNIAISSNAIYEAIGLRTDDHPDGFDLGLTQGLELRNTGEIDADNALANAAHIAAENAESPLVPPSVSPSDTDWARANAARIEAQQKAKAAAGPTAEELAIAARDAEIRESIERALKSLRANGNTQAPAQVQVQYENDYNVQHVLQNGDTGEVGLSVSYTSALDRKNHFVSEENYTQSVSVGVYLGRYLAQRAAQGYEPTSLDDSRAMVATAARKIFGSDAVHAKFYIDVAIDTAWKEMKRIEALGKRLNNVEASVAMDQLQDRKGKPHVKGGVWYDVGTDTYNWIGPKFGRPMSEPADQFLNEVGPYLDPGSRP